MFGTRIMAKVGQRVLSLLARLADKEPMEHESLEGSAEEAVPLGVPATNHTPPGQSSRDKRGECAPNVLSLGAPSSSSLRKW